MAARTDRETARPQKDRIARLAWLGCIAAAATAGSASADLDFAYGSETLYQFQVTHVPDFDQRRNALPNMGGVHCVPTSAMNWLAHFAAHGVPLLPPGDGWSWQAQINYNYATSQILNLGVLMGTAPPGGTTGDNGEAALQGWLASSNFVVEYVAQDSDWSPRFQNCAMQVAQGAYVLVGVGWYDAAGNRNGGHCMTLVYGERDGAQRALGVRDPATGEGDFDAQSAFATEFYDVETVYFNPQGLGWRWMDRVAGLGSGSNQAFIDSYYAIRPQFALTELGEFPEDITIVPVGTYGPVDPVQMDPTGGPIIVGTLLPDGSILYFAEDIGPDDVYVGRQDVVDGSSSEINFVLDDPIDVTVSDRRRVYVIDGTEIICLDMNEYPTIVEDFRHDVQCPIDALAYDDDLDYVIALSIDENAVIWFPHTLGVDLYTFPLPSTVELSGRISACWDEVHDTLWFVSDANDDLYAVRDMGASLIHFEYPDFATDPMALDVDNEGNLYVSSEGEIKEFYWHSNDLGWQPSLAPKFAGKPAGRFLEIAKSRSNFNVEIHGGPAYDDVLPTQTSVSVEDCPIDLDGDFAVTTVDLLMLLASWGPCDPASFFCDTDYNGDGQTSTVDLLMLLAAWGGC